MENLNNYINSKAVFLEDILDEDEEKTLFYKGDIVTILSIECEVDGFGTDYVNVKNELTGEIVEGISSSCLKLL